MKYLRIGLIVFCLSAILQLLPMLEFENSVLTKSVYATPGYSTVNITRSDLAWLYTNTWRSWSALCALTSADIKTNGEGQANIYTHSTALTFNAGVMPVGFDLDSIPAGAEIIDITLKCQAMRDWSGDFLNADLASSYYAFYKMINDNTSIELADFNNWKSDGYGIALSDYVRYYDLTDTVSDYTFDLDHSYFEDYDSWTDANNVLWFMFMPKRIVTGEEPYPGISGNSYVYLCPEQSAGGGSDIYMQVTYIADPSAIVRPAVDPVDNAAIDDDVSGNETAQSFSWQTPRCLYTGDDYGVIRVLGDSGANVTLTAKTESGDILGTISDSIRTDGDFDWRFPLPDDPAFIRIYETQHNIVSQWGRVENDPGDSLEWLQTYSEYQVSPQYDYPMDDYRIKENEQGFITWKINMTAGEQSDTDLKIYLNDQYTFPLYSSSFSDLNDDYYYTGNTMYDLMAFNSFMLYSPNVNSGTFKDYDGLVKNIAKNYSYPFSGFWTPVILYNDVVVADCHSAYFYLHDSDDDLTVSADSFTDAFSVYLTFGEYTKIIAYLPECNVQLINDSNEVVSQTDIYLHDGMNRADLMPLAETGNYQVRITCAGGLCPDYQYIYDWQFQAVEGGGIVEGDGDTGDVPGVTNWIDWLNNLLKRYHLDNEAGHWLVIFIICLAIYIAGTLTKNNHAWIAACALMVLVIVGAMIAGWINAWFIILVAMLIGIVIYSKFRKKTEGNTET